MPRSVEDAPLTTRAARERLKARHQPYWRAVDTGAAVGYRKGASGAAWLVRAADPAAGGGYRQGSIGRPDDALIADGVDVLDYRQAEAKARAWIARHNRIRAGLEPETGRAPAAPYTVREAMARYLDDFAARGGKGVRQTDVTINAHILPALGDVPVPRLTRDRIRDWHRELARKPARQRVKGGGTRGRDDTGDADAPRKRQSSANRILTVLKAALNHAKAEGVVTCPDDAWRAVKPFKETVKPKVRYLLDDEVTRLVNACSSDFRELVVGALLTGARYGELAAMAVADLDPQAGTVTIGRSKGGRPRHVVLTDEGRAFFDRLATGRPGTARMFERDHMVRQAGKDRDAETQRGAWGKSHQFRALRDACAAARIAPVISFHILRHSYASRLARNGAPLPVIAAQLGHSDTRMTERHYAHLAPSYVADAVRQAFGPMNIGTVPDGVVPLRRRA